MLNDNILSFLLNLFREVYTKGQEIQIYNDNGISVSLNSFLIALFIMGIILSTLISFARSASVNTKTKVKEYKSKKGRQEE